MLKLNKDCLSLIARDFCHLDIKNLSITCKYLFYNVYENRYLWLNKIEKMIFRHQLSFSFETIKKNPILFDLSVLKLAKIYRFLEMKNPLQEITIGGDFEIFKLFYDRFSMSLPIIASSYGHLEILKFLEDGHFDPSVSRIYFLNGVRNCHIDIVKFYLDKDSEGFYCKEFYLDKDSLYFKEGYRPFYEKDLQYILTSSDEIIKIVLEDYKKKVSTYQYYKTLVYLYKINSRVKVGISNTDFVIMLSVYYIAESFIG